MVFTNRGRRALQGQPEPATHGLCFPVPVTLVQIQVGSLRRTPATWQCHRFHGVLQDDYLRVISSCNTLLQQSSSAPCCSFNSWYWSQHQRFRGQSPLGIGKTEQNCWLKLIESSESERQKIQGIWWKMAFQKGFCGNTAKTAVTVSFTSWCNCRQCSSDGQMEKCFTRPRKSWEGNLCLIGHELVT